MNLFTDSLGKVISWYTGSATSFGSSYQDNSSVVCCRHIGRIFSYLSGSTPQTCHDRYLHRCIGAHLSPNSRKFAKRTTGYSGLHRVYWIGLETYIMVLTSFDTKPETAADWQPADTRERVQKFREKHSIKIFDIVHMYSCLPLNQGIRADPRFVVDAGSRTCHNPDADCPAGTSILPITRWLSFSKGKVFNGEQLCYLCYYYHRRFSCHRTATTA